MNYPDSYDFRRYPIRGGLFPEAIASYSWLLQGQHDAAKAALAKLTDAERDSAMAAAAVLIAIAGGVPDVLPQRINTPCAVCGRAGCAERFHPAWLDGAPA